MNPIFYGTVKDGKLKLESRDLFLMYVESFDGHEVQLTLKKKSKPRSNQQNRYYWGVVIKTLADHLGYTPDEMHDALRMKFLIDRERQLPTIKSTTTLSTITFEEYMTSVRQWASQELDCYIPEPNEVDYESEEGIS